MKRIILILLTLATGFVPAPNTMAAVIAPGSLAGRAFIGTMTSPLSERVVVVFGDSTCSNNIGGYGPYTYTNINANHSVLTLVEAEPGDKNGDVSTLHLAFVTDYSGNITGQVAFSGGGSKPLVGTFTLDVAPPTLTFTSPQPGARRSSSVFTASGTANDNVAVAAVYYQLNSGDWTPAGTANAWKTWYATNLSLLVGTNVLNAYAVDTSTNYSRTNTVKFEFVVTNALAMQIVGGGAPQPNYSGRALAINTSYTMKAVPATGFAFDSWSGGVPTSTNRSLTFTMSTNLSITATFKDVQRPVDVILSPTVNKQWTNPVITVTGKARDNVGVSSVWVQINTNDWVEAGMTSSFTNWSATNLTVLSGTNWLRTFALDAAGNASLTNQVKFIGVLAPESLSGYSALAKPTGGKHNLVITWGDSTWSQTGEGADTNADDYCAGTYTYLQTGPHTALLTNIDIGMMSALGTTNVTTVNMTFTGAAAANYSWSTATDSGSGTMTFSHVNNLVPATLAGRTTLARNTLMAYAGDGTFTETKAGSLAGNGTYAFTQFSPTVGILQLNFADANEAGAVAYVELTFTPSTTIHIAQSWYANPAFDSYPDDWGLATGIFR